MDPSSILSAPRIRLDPFAEVHMTQRYVSGLNDSPITRLSGQRRHTHSLESCRRFWQSFAGTANRFWAIVLREEGRHIGNITCHIDVANSVGDLGILVGESD